MSRLTGISVKQIYRWLAQANFQEELEKRRNKLSKDAVDKLKVNLTKAATTLVKLLDSNSEAMRRGASNDILNHILRIMELREIEVRLATLEATSQQRYQNAGL